MPARVRWYGGLTVTRPASIVPIVVSKPTFWQRLRYWALMGIQAGMMAGFVAWAIANDVLHVFFSAAGLALLVGLLGGRR